MRRGSLLLVATALLLVACSRPAAAPVSPGTGPPLTEPAPPPSPPADPGVTAANLQQIADKYHPNELGKVLILEYHHFGTTESRWTRTYDNFRRDLQTLYEQGYRAVNLNDYLDDHMRLPAGTSPVIFTFDDSLASQFHLNQQDGILTADPNTAVGIMLDFAKQHPDFGVAGTFYINLTNPFQGAGSEAQRLQFLVDHGFEIGNHTVNHENLSQITSDQVQKTIAEQADRVSHLVPGYQETTLALTFGVWPKEHKLAWEGEFGGIRYKYRAVLLVGSEPAPSVLAKSFDPLALPRVQAIDSELTRWLSYLKTNRYVSDGDANTVVAPKEEAKGLNQSTLGKRQLLTY